MMGNVNTQIQRAISDAINNQIQTALNAGSGHSTQNIPYERLEINSEESYGEKVKKNTSCEQRIDHQSDVLPHSRAYDSTFCLTQTTASRQI